MKTFDQWLEENKLTLPMFSDSEESKDATSEDTKRAGISQNYPDAYVRAQYPHKYFNPIAADADYKLSAKPRKGGSDTAAN
jgi:hypothetical protein